MISLQRLMPRFPLSRVRYSSGLEADSPVTLRPWQLSFYGETGEKRFQRDETARALAVLILPSWLSDGWRHFGRRRKAGNRSNRGGSWLKLVPQGSPQLG